MSLHEYLRRERLAEFKHEYRRGYMFPIQGPDALPVNMSGGKLGHSKLKTNLIGELHNRLRGKSCQPYDSDLKVVIPEKRRGIYPDASVFCGPVEFFEGREDVTLNPTVLFEVLSPSTEASDRGEKFVAVRRILSLRLYVLISQEQMLVEIYERSTDAEHWHYTAHMGSDAVAKLPAIGIELPLTDLYEGVEFPPDDPAAKTAMHEAAAAYQAY
jgi:Uma2 family endonuclease